MNINIDNYATTIIDNNDDVAEKTITLFKDIGRNWNSEHKSMCGIVRINNIRNGFVSYDFSDYKLEYPLNSTIFTTSNLPNGMQIKTYINGELNKTEDVLVSNDFQKIMGNAVIYSFNYDYPVDIEIKFSFGYGLRKYQIGTTPEECHCCCSKCSGGDPVYDLSSLYDYIDLKITYNLSGSGEDAFYNFQADFNEFKELPGKYSFKREFDIGELNFRMVDIGINENKAIDFSFFDNNWDPEIEDEGLEIDYKDGPCIRNRVIGTILREDVQRFRDHSQGELPEEPHNNKEITKENIKSSDIFKRINFNGTNQICELNTYEIINFSEKNKIGDGVIKVYLIIDNKKTKLVIEYIFNLPNVMGKENNRLRFKSKIDIGLNFKLD